MIWWTNWNARRFCRFQLGKDRSNLYEHHQKSLHLLQDRNFRLQVSDKFDHKSSERPVCQELQELLRIRKAHQQFLCCAEYILQPVNFFATSVSPVANVLMSASALPLFVMLVSSIRRCWTGAGTGIVVSYLFSPDSSIRTTVIIVGIIMIGIDWYEKSKSDKKVFQYTEQLKNIDLN